MIHRTIRCSIITMLLLPDGDSPREFVRAYKLTSLVLLPWAYKHFWCGILTAGLCLARLTRAISIYCLNWKTYLSRSIHNCYAHSS
jgi:hypothetical protein